MGELATNSRHFPHYAYCPLSESRIRPKEAKIQFVALITSKPQVTPGKVNPKTGKVEGGKLVWTVADRSGTVSLPNSPEVLIAQRMWYAFIKG